MIKLCPSALSALSMKPMVLQYLLPLASSYMISAEMFAQFVLPTIQEDVAWLKHSIYHLDGVGEIKHLDALLALDKLDAVQWVFGDGQPGTMHWLDLYRRIQSAGKRMMLLGAPDEILAAMEILGGKGAYVNIAVSDREQNAVKALLAKR